MSTAVFDGAVKARHIDRLIDHHIPIGQRELIRRAVADRMYGPYVGQMILHGNWRVASRLTSSETLADALGRMATLYLAASEDYERAVRKRRRPPIPDDVLHDFQQRVLAGELPRLPKEYWFTRAEGIRQVVRAETVMTGRTSAVRAEIAALNYGAIFNANTMATPAETLRNRTTGQIEAIIKDPSTAQGMGHLIWSNWGIAQSVGTVVAQAVSRKPPMKVRILDIGSGDGSTLAPIVESIRAVFAEKRTKDEDFEPPALAITTTEATQKYYDSLTNFARSEYVTSLGLEVESMDSGQRYPNGRISQFGKITCICGDAVDAIANALWGDDPDTITIVTANYSLHRFTLDEKIRMFEAIHAAGHVAYFGGDLLQNGSPINLGHFDPGVNGSLNNGNIGWLAALRNMRFSTPRASLLLPSRMLTAIAQVLARGADDGKFFMGASDEFTLGLMDLDRVIERSDLEIVA